MNAIPHAALCIASDASASHSSAGRNPKPCAHSMAGTPSRQPGQAFSLVEIAICLGIVSFVLLALLGLLSVGLDAGKSSREDTIAAGLGMALLAELKNTPYASLATGSNAYFTYDGSPTSNAADGYYQCMTEVSTSQLPQPALQNFAKRVKIEVMWPLAAPEAKRQTNLFETHLAAY